MPEPMKIMPANSEPCHGVFECLQPGSDRRLLSPILKPWQKLRSYLVWHRENLGGTTGLTSACRSIWLKRKGRSTGDGQRVQPGTQEVLALEPGELVEVKSVREILATLDANRRCKGLLWMTGMCKFCGKRYRVYKRVQRITLESNGELRQMKNTVLLEGVCCDGREFGGCDRSCFHFWREAWLRRAGD